MGIGNITGHGIGMYRTSVITGFIHPLYSKRSGRSGASSVLVARSRAKALSLGTAPVGNGLHNAREMHTLTTEAPPISGYTLGLS